MCANNLNHVARCAHLCYTRLEFDRPVPDWSMQFLEPARTTVRYRGQKSGRVTVSEPASISTGIAQRYATAIFELSLEDKSLGELESGIDDLSDALNVSADLRDLITSPLVSRDAQGRSIAKIAEKMELIPVLQKTLALMAEKRRLFVLPQLIEQLHTKIADHKGEVTAEVVTVKPLTKTQIEKLSKSLAARVGKSVKINATVDDTLVGGLVVKVGSKMIDTSIRSKLASLQNEMKEVG